LKKAIFIISLLSLLIAGCSTSKYIPEKAYLLEGVEIHSDVKDFNVSTLVPYIRQKANSKWFSLFKIPLGTYSISGRDSTKWLNRTLKKMGEAPVIFDSTQARLSVEDLRNALKNMGYMHASVDFYTKTKGKRLTAIYNLHLGKPYTINEVNYDIEDSAIAKILQNYIRQLSKKDKKSLVLSKGSTFTLQKLEDERKRITDILLDSGYYKFHKDFIQFDADTASTENDVNITLHLLKFRSSSGSPETDHPRYTIRKISFTSDQGKLQLRRSVLDNATQLKEGQPYNYSALEDTYRNFGRLSAVRYTNIQFREVPDTTLLDCDIQLNTSKPSTIAFQPEGTNTAGDLGAAMSITYQNRNIFRGSELFSAELRGAYEAITGLEGYNDENFVEWSAETRLQFPRFIAPFVSKEMRRRSTASSELSLSWDMQNRPEFHRRVFSAAWRYRWSSPDRHINYRLDVPEINYVYMPWISETFKHDYLDSVSNRNAILRYNYEDLFIMKVGFGLTYTNGTDAMRFNIETAGNLLNSLSGGLRFSRNSSGQHTLFGIAYAQYAKFDFDYTHLITFDEHNSLALHTDFGIAYPYGNSTVLPFEKRYFSGGANSVRGWSVRELGPGSYKGKNGRIDFINQTGDMKFDLNAEYRTYLFWKFNGAAFIDAGNIWTLRDYPDQPGGQFKWNKFYKQIAVAYGLGLRLNFGYFILRFDMGMKAINPAYSNSHEHYAIIHPDFSRDFTFHFAVGMPF
jgi:outer membrane protein assembly factor BamA